MRSYFFVAVTAMVAATSSLTNAARINSENLLDDWEYDPLTLA